MEISLRNSRKSVSHYPVFRSLLIIAIVAVLPARAGILDDLSAEDAKKVLAGNQVIVGEDLEGYPWPRVRLYQTVKATPREVMAIFFDYNNAKSFVPNCEKSEISRKIDERTHEVDYLVNIPIFPDEAYTVRNKLSGDPSRLSVQWKVLRATSIEESEGDLVVEALGDGSVLRYTNLVKPSSKAAGLLKGIALGQMKETVKAIVDQVMVAKKSGMEPQLERLDKALGRK